MSSYGSYAFSCMQTRTLQVKGAQTRCSNLAKARGNTYAGEAACTRGRTARQKQSTSEGKTSAQHPAAKETMRQWQPPRACNNDCATHARKKTCQRTRNVRFYLANPIVNTSHRSLSNAKLFLQPVPRCSSHTFSMPLPTPCVRETEIPRYTTNKKLVPFLYDTTSARGNTSSTGNYMLLGAGVWL